MCGQVSRVARGSRNNRTSSVGHGDEEDTSTPRVITGLRRVRSIAAGAVTSLAVHSAGAVLGWGMGLALGLDPGEDQLDPRRLGSLVVQQA